MFGAKFKIPYFIKKLWQSVLRYFPFLEFKPFSTYTSHKFFRIQFSIFVGVTCQDYSLDFGRTLEIAALDPIRSMRTRQTA